MTICRSKQYSKLQQLWPSIGGTSLLSSSAASIARFQCCQCQQGGFSRSPGPRLHAGTAWARDNDNLIIKTTCKTTHKTTHKTMHSTSQVHVIRSIAALEKNQIFLQSCETKSGAESLGSRLALSPLFGMGGAWVRGYSRVHADARIQQEPKIAGYFEMHVTL